MKRELFGQLFVPVVVLNDTATSTFMYLNDGIVMLFPPAVLLPLKPLESRTTSLKSVFLYSQNQLL